MGRNKRREGGGKNLGPSLIGEGHTQVEGEEDNYPLPPHSIANSFPKILLRKSSWKDILGVSLVFLWFSCVKVVSSN